MRIQFDIDENLASRLLRYVSNVKMRHFIGHQALEEWINRREGRDKKLQLEQRISDKKILKPLIEEMVESGELKIEG